MNDTELRIAVARFHPDWHFDKPLDMNTVAELLAEYQDHIYSLHVEVVHFSTVLDVRNCEQTVVTAYTATESFRAVKQRLAELSEDSATPELIARAALHAIINALESE